MNRDLATFQRSFFAALAKDDTDEVTGAFLDLFHHTANLQTEAIGFAALIRKLMDPNQRASAEATARDILSKIDIHVKTRQS